MAKTPTLSFAQAVTAPDTRPQMIEASRRTCSTRAEFRAEIIRLWGEAEKRFLAIGRYLLEAKERLAHGEFKAMIAEDLPLSYPAAFRMMSVAKAIDEGVVARDQIPASYTVAYEIISLDEDERTQAIAAGLVRPDVRRAEIMAFKRQLRAPDIPAPTEIDAEKRARLRQLLVERDRLDQKIAALRAELGELPPVA